MMKARRTTIFNNSACYYLLFKANVALLHIANKLSFLLLFVKYSLAICMNLLYR
jgi:hypothetical protein